MSYPVACRTGHVNTFGSNCPWQPYRPSLVCPARSVSINLPLIKETQKMIKKNEWQDHQSHSPSLTLSRNTKRCQLGWDGRYYPRYSNTDMMTTIHRCEIDITVSEGSTFTKMKSHLKSIVKERCFLKRLSSNFCYQHLRDHSHLSQIKLNIKDADTEEMIRLLISAEYTHSTNEVKLSVYDKNELSTPMYTGKNHDYFFDRIVEMMIDKRRKFYKNRNCDHHDLNKRYLGMNDIVFLLQKLFSLDEFVIRITFFAIFLTVFLLYNP